MLRALIGFSIRQPLVVIALAISLLLYAGVEMSRAGLDIFPEFAPKQVIIQTEAPGFSPLQVEQQVSHPIEIALAGLNALQSLRSESIQGLSVVIATFAESSDIYRNRQLVAERLSSLSNQLPAGIQTPHAVPLSSSSATILTLGVEAKQLSAMQLRNLAETIIVPQLLSVEGVADVNLFGGEIRQLQIHPRAADMRRYDISWQQIREAASQAIHQQGLGFIENENQRLTLTVAKNNNPLITLSNIALQAKTGSLRLVDVADIDYGAEPPISAASIAGKPGIVMMVIGQYGANTLSVSRRLQTVLDNMQEKLAQQQVRLHTHLFRPADYIETSITNLSGHLLIGTGFVLLVILLFLFNLRSALISTVAIPLSLSAAALMLIKSGVNLNIMVLGGLAIALGEVVDDAIIDTENIYRRLNQQRRISQQALSKAKVRQIIMDASLEVRSSVVYASFIVALVFVPLLTLSGIAGRLYAPLGVAYILAILMSLLVALTVTPALAVCLLQKNSAQSKNQQQDPPLIRYLKPVYARLLQAVLKHSWIAISISILTIIIGVCAIPLLQHEFIPQLREGHLILHTSSRPGTSLDESIRSGKQISQAVLALTGVESVSQWAGRAERGADTYGSHYSEYEIRLYPASGQKQQQIETEIRSLLDDFPGMLFELNTFLTERVNETISGYSAPLAINLFGQDLTALDLKAAEIATVLNTIDGIEGVRIQSPTGAPLLQIELHEDKLRLRGILPAQLLETIQGAYSGSTVGHLYQRNRPLAISVILPEHQHKHPQQLGKLPIRSADGVWYKVADFATIRQTEGRYNVLHRDSKRLQTITAQLDAVDLAQLSVTLQHTLLQQVQLDADMHLQLTGAAFEQSASKRQLLTDSLLASAAVLLLIYLAIGDARHVLITLLNLPFSLIGGILAALLTNMPISIGSMVGFVTLFGITVRNSIMLISHYQYLLREEHLAWNSATIIRGAQERLPSILMTALVTALAMLPIALESDNPGREIMGPMAVIIIGGLMSSTLLNLFLLPGILYRYGQPSSTSSKRI